ncbi:MAG: hypothetical protein HOP11_14270 [Saprospiraceae bacterium]|nr:hypothetical protein [Saprospiraceae bacterium]
MSQTSIIAILLGTLVYLACYYILFGVSFFYESWTKGILYTPETKNPISSGNLVYVGVMGLLYSFFHNLFMIMSERSGMADGIKTSLMLTLVHFGIPLAIYFKLNEYSWNKYFKILFVFLSIQILVGAVIGLKAF